MSLFLIVRWWVWLLAALFGAGVAMLARPWVSRRRPQWSARRHALAAASLAPAFILGLTLAGMVASLASISEGEWGDLAAAALISLGGSLAVTGLFGGLMAAAFPVQAPGR